MIALTLLSLAALEMGCMSQRRAGTHNKWGQPYGPAPRHAPVPIQPETYSPAPPKHFASAPLYLPGHSTRQLVNFEVVGGMAIFEGDIMLGPVASLPALYGFARPANPHVHGAMAVKSTSYRWPGGVIPFVIDSSLPASKIADINWAIGQVNQSAVTMRPRVAEKDYVKFTTAGSGYGCSSYVGRIGGEQSIKVNSCSKGSIIHEIGHALGFYHEQSRTDRDAYITIAWDEISPGNRRWFEIRKGGIDIGPYDYGSIMHYSGRAFSKSGKATIIPKTPGARIGQREGLSSLDLTAIAQLYSGSPPVTPPGPPTTPPTTPPGPVASGSFAGKYSSERGAVACTQSGSSVSCRYPGGTMLCAVRGSNQLDCGWVGGGQGRARFQRGSNGVLAGTWGDMLSTNSRGAWNLTPAGGTSPPTQPPPPPGPKKAASLTGNYTSTRGPMSCAENGPVVTCNFQESGANGRLDCTKSQNGLQLSCSWLTFLPRAGTGRATFTRATAQDRNLSGTWGHFTAASGGGSWDMKGQ